MTTGFIAKASVKINAPVARVWDALINPDTIRQYMFGTNTETDWKEGSSITWRGEWEGKAYEDKGTIERIIPNKLLQYTYHSSLSDEPQGAESYHHVINDLQEVDDGVILTITQDGSKTEEKRDHSQKNWEYILNEIKKLTEQS